MLIALGAAASPALGAYTLNLSAPPTPAVGQPVVIQASGSNPPTDFFSSWLDVSAIPASVLSACPAGYLNAFQVASSTGAQGGEVVARAVREDVDARGNFSIPSVYTPTVPGRFLICGYTNDGAAAHSGDGIAGPERAGSSAQGPARPANVSKPRVRRSGKKLVCKRGRWSNGPTRFSYAWLVNGKAKKGRAAAEAADHAQAARPQGAVQGDRVQRRRLQHRRERALPRLEGGDTTSSHSARSRQRTRSSCSRAARSWPAGLPPPRPVGPWRRRRRRHARRPC